MQSQTPRSAYNDHARRVPAFRPGPPSRKAPWLALGAYFAGFLGVALAAVCLALFLSYRSTATTQIRQLQEAAASAQVDNQSNISSLNALSGKVNTIDAGMAALAPYDQVCSQDLTGANGPAQFFFLCTDQKP